ncbi:MAG: virulence RhuM family protein [Proteobacteria bacterium]|nr:virulence RhuM family protein [Pseudomonadota bacterium]
MQNLTDPEGEILLYQTEDGQTRIDVRLVGDDVWLTQMQMTELFQKDKRTISEHIQNVFSEGELSPGATVRNFRTVQKEGQREVSRELTYYNLDVIISVGYRVKSHRGTQFRIWATQRLKEYLVKGFTMDDERLKQIGGGNYFDELLSRIRDIRSSEKVFWRKVLDIYATSIDYDPNIEITKEFFKMVQNKMHWAAHGRTAAEVIYERANAEKPNMGLTTWKKGIAPSRSDAEIAKNYLSEEELDILNRLVSMYLDFAELQAKSKRPMYMGEWVQKLDDFIKLNEREILTHAGKITNQKAKDKANLEYDKFRALTSSNLSPVEEHFLEALEKTKKLEGSVKAQSKNKDEQE